ncbi:MAG: VOC family protein [bacterium]
MQRIKPLVLLIIAGFASASLAAPDSEAPQRQITPTMPAVEFRDNKDLGLMSRFHFATHTRDFDKAREFCRQLGYTEGVSGFPLTNTHLMARALGMYDLCQYELVKGEVIMLPGSPGSGAIDLLQFKTPFNDEPPYELPNHLGMAYAALLTSNLDADIHHLDSLGVEFLSQPHGNVGNRFVFFRDPEGVLYKLFETAPPVAAETATTHIKGMPYIGVNVSDFETSLKFYASLGYTDVKPLPATGTLEEAQAYGLEQPFHIKGADISITRGDRHTLRLVQWLEPYNAEPPYPLPINRTGINRIALMVPDVDRAVDILHRQGVPFVSQIAPCCSGSGSDATGIVHAIDPDGIFLELVGAIEPRGPIPQPEHCPALVIKMPAAG